MEKDAVLPVPFVILVFISKERSLLWKKCNNLNIIHVCIFFSKDIDYFLATVLSLPCIQVHGGSFLVHRYTLWSPFAQPVMLWYSIYEKIGTQMHKYVRNSWRPGSFTRPFHASVAGDWKRDACEAKPTPDTCKKETIAKGAAWRLINIESSSSFWKVRLKWEFLGYHH